uniref:GFA family protein n=1 Tax=Roseovarius indicus TaxID=540747 RepID=UPI003B51612D
MKITGACHCGDITYEAELDPARFGICHCTDCQVTSASAFRTIAVVKQAEFRLLSGTPKTYIKQAESGNRRALTFCSTCGAGLWATDEKGESGLVNLRAGTITERRDLTPRYEIWCSSAMPWLARFDGTERHDKGFT